MQTERLNGHLEKLFVLVVKNVLPVCTYTPPASHSLILHANKIVSVSKGKRGGNKGE